MRLECSENLEFHSGIYLGMFGSSLASVVQKFSRRWLFKLLERGAMYALTTAMYIIDIL